MSLIKNNVLAGASGSQDYLIDESLRFNASQSSYLSRTVGSAATSNTLTTFSFWFKRANLGTAQKLFTSATSAPNVACYIELTTSDTIRIYLDMTAGGSDETTWVTTAVFRDVSAWYHGVIKIDTSQASNSNKVVLYINNVSQTLTATQTGTAVTTQRILENGISLAIGKYFNSSGYGDFYLTEFNCIDGQALTPTDFGETDGATGVWKPKKYVGTYGTNGFYLPMKLDNTVEGFNTVTYIGTGSKQKISGVGFSPDLVWMKSRTSATDNHYLANSVSGVQKALFSNLTLAEATDSTGLLSFDTDGFTIGTQAQINTNTVSHVAWCWDAGNSTVSNSDGSITSSVRANQTYGFSVVTYTGTGANATVGHGLGSAPSMVIVKNRNTSSYGWFVWHTAFGTAGNTDYINLNLTDQKGSGGSVPMWNSTVPTSSVFSLGTYGGVNGNTNTYVAYCFSEVSGYSKFGSYTGTGASGNAVTTGFRPAFVMIKSSTDITNWMMYDATRDGTSSATKYLTANTSGAEGTLTPSVEFTATGFTVNYNASPLNASGATYIYMAFKDTREYAYWLDDSGNNNDWQPNGGITTQSSVTDVPTLTSPTASNYATFSSVASTVTSSISEANLKVSGVSNSINGTIAVTSGKYYFEFTKNANGDNQLGIAYGWGQAGTYSFRRAWRDGNGSPSWLTDGGTAGSGTAQSLSAGDILGVALDMDNNAIYFAKNNTWMNSGDPTSGASKTGAIWTDLSGQAWQIFAGGNANGCYASLNCGQRPFAYTPPTGFKALNTYNLPDSTVKDGSDYFNTVLYTGDGATTRSITGLSFAPDFLWNKTRSNADDHRLVDIVRAGGTDLSSSVLYSNLTNAQDNSSGYITQTSSGFDLGVSATPLNMSGRTYVSWAWKANGSGVSNTDGSITSTVSANTTAGFSIVTYTGNGTAGATVGHGLGTKPSLIICKDRDVATSWPVYHESLGATKWILLNSTLGATTSSQEWNNTEPTADVFSIGNASSNSNQSDAYVAYCFAEVEGFSKMGSYTGNGSADGPFVYTGFRPAFVIIKRTDTSDSWQVYDTARDNFNTTAANLYPNLSNAEVTDNTGQNIDILSNGFKLRNTNARLNASGGTYIYIAFAENPFKNSLAR